MPPKDQEVSQSQNETLGTDHVGSVESSGKETQGNNPPVIKSDTTKNKFIVELTLVEDPRISESETLPTVTKYHLSQQTVAYINCNGVDVPTVQSRSMWLKLSGDNPLDLENGDTFKLDKRNTRLTKSSWLSNPENPDSEVYSTHWITPKEFPMRDNEVPAEW